jgi:predicted phage-related endonuclease
MITLDKTPLEAAAAVSATELEAAENEGLVKANAKQVALLKRYHAKKDRLNALQAELDEIRDEFRAQLEEDALQGLLVNGKVMVRRSVVNTPRIDTKKLKADFPEIANQLVLVTTSVRMTIQ